MSRAWIVVAPFVFGACSSKDEPPLTPPSVARDAGVSTDGITVIGHFDPNSGMHLDDDGPTGPVKPRLPRPPGKLVDITLRSSPPGAIAAVDGQQIGRTPTYAPVTSGVEHDFTFVLDGYALARYRFVPIQSGIVHPTLEAVSTEIDAGVQLPPEMVRAPPSPLAPPPPPPTLVSPPDAAAPIDSATATPSGSSTGPLPF